MRTRFLPLALLTPLLGGCLAGAAVGAAVDVTGAVVGTAVKTTGAVVGAVLPDGKDKDEEDENR